MCGACRYCKVNVTEQCVCKWLNIVTFSCPFCLPSRCATACGQEAGPQCPDVPLPAPEAADALPGEVSHTPTRSYSSLCLPPAPCPPSLPALSAASNLFYLLNILWLRVSLCVTSADTGMSQKFLTLERQRMRRTRMEISQCMSVLGWRLWVNSAV